MVAVHAIHTAVFGDYDDVPTQCGQDLDVDWVCFTENPDLDVPAPWRVVVIDLHTHGIADLHPRLQATWAKTHPHVLLPDYRWTIWIDANTATVSAAFARDAVATAVSGMALYRHPRRDCIYEEAVASVALLPTKYAQCGLDEQVAHYRREGHPEHWGLWAAGTLVIDQTNEVVGAVLADWWDECRTWSYQTQLSLPVVLRRHDFHPDVFDHAQRPGNPWQQLHSHRSNR